MKTNGKPAKWWLVNPRATELRSDSHAYVSVNIRGEGRPEYLVAPSAYVAKNVVVTRRKTGSVWYGFNKKARPSDGEGWELFGDPHVGPD